ncbi:hypothetical protein LshimejAT787_0312010 [Lyophyllum shimeji]|uniref:Uncharacterized protein n=1 Tax=Lyophyllum shimeji TaxID=47721 RepID=A0A9P3PK37_LYOSH|nr:hypothetical protein LshimejAT787_0312010 [Lyophyllum shimeji]
MPCLLSLVLLFLPVLSVSATVTLGIPAEAGVQVLTDVKWTRDEGDPRVFDLRYIDSAGADVGFAATVRADKGVRNGTVPVIFPTEGQFTLKAVDFENGDKVIAESQPVKVGPDAPSTTQPPATSVSSPSPPPTTPPASCMTLRTSTTPPSPSPVESTSVSCSPTSSSPSTPNLPPTGATAKPSSKTPAIVGGVIGGVALLALLMLLAFVIRRRRDNARTQRRLTFHRDLMVQRRPADLENGTPLPVSFQQPITVPTPAGPTKAGFPASAITMPVPEPAPALTPTPRQMQLADRIRELEQGMMAIRRQNRGQAGMKRVLEHMRMQAEWLRDQWDSPWAKGETDVPPPHLDMYME